MPRDNITDWTPPNQQSKLFTFLFYCGYIIALFASTFAAAFFEKEAFCKNTLITVVIALSAIGTVRLQAWQNHHNKKLEEKRHKHLIQFNDQLGAILTPLRKLNTTRRDTEQANFFIEQILQAGVGLFPEEGIRLCLYTLSSNEEADPTEPLTDSAESSLYLQLDSAAGRQDRPRFTFKPDSDSGLNTIKIARGHTPRCFSDIGKDNPDIDRQPGSVWKSYMQFPLQGVRRNYGSLMIDCREDIAWTREHQAVGQTIATLVTYGLEARSQFSEIRTGLEDEQIKRLSLDTGPYSTKMGIDDNDKEVS